MYVTRAALSPRQGKAGHLPLGSRVTALWSSSGSPWGWKKEVPPTGHTKKVRVVA